MANLTVEERLTELEAKVARLQSETQINSPKPVSWLDKHFGAFKDSVYYDAAMELGAEYRRSQPTAADASEEDTNAASSGH